MVACMKDALPEVLPGLFPASLWEVGGRRVGFPFFLRQSSRPHCW